MSLATATAATAAAVAVVPGSASAQSVAQVKAEIDQLNHQAEAATNAYEGAQEQLANLRARVNRLQATIAGEQNAIGTLEGSLGQLAAAQYRGGGVDSTLQLMLSQHPDSFLQQSTTLDELTGQEAAALARLQQADRQLRQSRLEAAQALDAMQATERTLATEKATIQGKLNRAQALLNSLTPAERTTVEGVADTTANVTAVAPDARAATAIAYVKSKLGASYVWGASGPATFDCSGLMQAAWAAAGVSIPRTTYEQYAGLTHISESQLQPGDLVFVDGLEHVGMYVGNGWVIHAPHTGTVVQYVRLQFLGSYYGAARA